MPLRKVGSFEGQVLRVLGVNTSFSFSAYHNVRFPRNNEDGSRMLTAALNDLQMQDVGIYGGRPSHSSFHWLISLLKKQSASVSLAGSVKVSKMMPQELYPSSHGAKSSISHFLSLLQTLLSSSIPVD